MHKACGCYDLVRRITPKIELRNTPANGKINRPNMDSSQGLSQLARLHIDLDTPQLCQLRQLP